MWQELNLNPISRRVGDCAVRAVAKALDVDWETAYIMIALNGLTMGDMPSSNQVFGATLRQNGFKKKSLPVACPDCYTIKMFAEANPKGTFVIGTGDHVVCAKDGDYFDTWDSGELAPLYVWYKDVTPTFDT